MSRSTQQMPQELIDMMTEVWNAPNNSLIYKNSTGHYQNIWTWSAWMVLVSNWAGVAPTFQSLSLPYWDTFSIETSSLDWQLTVFSWTRGKTIKKNTMTGVAKLSNWVVSVWWIWIWADTTGTLPVNRWWTWLTSLWSPLQFLRVNSSGTSLEFVTALNLL